LLAHLKGSFWTFWQSLPLVKGLLASGLPQCRAFAHASLAVGRVADKRLEVTRARLDHLVPVRKTFVLGQDETPGDNFLRGMHSVLPNVVNSCGVVNRMLMPPRFLGDS